MKQCKSLNKLYMQTEEEIGKVEKITDAIIDIALCAAVVALCAIISVMSVMGIYELLRG